MPRLSSGLWSCWVGICEPTMCSQRRLIGVTASVFRVLTIYVRDEVERNWNVAVEKYISEGAVNLARLDEPPAWRADESKISPATNHLRTRFPRSSNPIVAKLNIINSQPFGSGTDAAAGSDL